MLFHKFHAWLFLILCVILWGVGCGPLVRRVPNSLPSPPGQPTAAPKTFPPSDPEKAPGINPLGNSPEEPSSPGVVTPAPAPTCGLRVFAEPVRIRRYSTEGITIDDHIHVMECSAGPFELGVSGGRGTVKKVASGGIKYYPPTKEADPAGSISEDSLQITVKCAHGTEVKTEMRIEIYGPPKASGSSEDSLPRERQRHPPHEPLKQKGEYPA